MVDQGLTVSMTEFIVLHVLDSARQGPRLRAAQRARQWLDLDPVAPGTIVVAILGLGTLGADAATRLAALGFSVRGWSRSRKEIAGIESFAGSDGFKACLSGAHILVCLLPLTDDTRGILGAAAFAPLARGAVLISGRTGRSPGRSRSAGRPAIRPALARRARRLRSRAAARRSCILAASSGDGDPRHVAAITRPGTGAADIVENYRRALAGVTLINQVDRAKGY